MKPSLQEFPPTVLPHAHPSTMKNLPSFDRAQGTTGLSSGNRVAAASRCKKSSDAVRDRRVRQHAVEVMAFCLLLDIKVRGYSQGSPRGAPYSARVK